MHRALATVKKIDNMYRKHCQKNIIQRQFIAIPCQRPVYLFSKIRGHARLLMTLYS